jgi:hypothetical protein
MAEPSKALIVAHKSSIDIAGVSVSFQRTLRIPDDGKLYPLPPGLGCFPIHRVEDHAGGVPESWLGHGGVFLPMYQREAMWIRFGVPHWPPRAVKIAVGMVNAITGSPWDDRLSRSEQDYLVCPDQPWIDGIKSADGEIRQFVAMPLGMGYTVEGQVTGEEHFGGLQIAVHRAKKSRLPKTDSTRSRGSAASLGPHSELVEYPQNLHLNFAASNAGAEMGLAAGGRMDQKIYPDPYGGDTWKTRPDARLYVHIVNSHLYQEITSQRPPESPISAQTYTQHGYPWFALYDETQPDVPVPDTLAGVKSVKQMDAEKGFSLQQDDTTVPVADGQVIGIPTGPAPKP